jgi:hypothetical protein
MRKIFRNLTFCVFSILALSSCNDALDIVQDGEINNETTFRSVADVRSFLIGEVYRRLDITNEIAFTAVFTDEVGIGNNSGGQGVELHRYFLFPTDGYASGMWLQKYTMINRINRLIEVSNLVTPVDASEQAELDAILAEARTLRAYCYLQLQAFYSPDMSNDNALGVMLLDFVPNFNTALPRATNAQIFSFMESDLLFAENNLGSSTNYKYVTPALVDAIRARMYLYRKNYVLAEQYANSAITLSGLSLSTTATYNAMWNDTNRGETIFAASRPSAGGWGNIAGQFFFNTTSLTGGCFHDMGRKLFEALDANPTDVRRTSWVDATSTFNANTPGSALNPNWVTADAIIINKYPGKTSQPLRNDLKLFRISEMNLILAECQVGKASPDLAAAATYVQAIRTRRNTGTLLPVYATAQDAWADILLERRKELCFEGHRYVDLKRLGTLANASIDRSLHDDSILSTPLTLPITDYRFTLPIPQSEIEANPSIQQNSNY